MTLADIRVRIPNLLTELAGDPLELTSEVIELEEFNDFLQQTLAVPALVINSPLVDEKSQSLTIIGITDVFDKQNLEVAITFTAHEEDVIPIIEVKVVWPAAEVLNFGAYSMEQMAVYARWMRKDDSGNPLFYGALAGIMKLGSVESNVVIRFPEAPGRVFITGELSNLTSPTIAQIAAIVKVPELADWLPDTLANASGISLDSFGILADVQSRQVNMITVGISADNWTLAENILAVKDLNFDIQVDNPGGGQSIAALLETSLEVGGVDVPIIISIDPDEWLISVSVADRLELPTLNDLLGAIGGEDVVDSLPAGFDPSIVTKLDVLEIRYAPDARKVQQVYFYINLDWDIIEDSVRIEQAFIGMNILTSEIDNTKEINGNVGGTLFLGEVAVPLESEFDNFGNVLLQLVSETPIPLPSVQNLISLFPGSVNFNSFVPSGVSLSTGLEVGAFELEVLKEEDGKKQTTIDVLLGFPGTFGFVDNFTLEELSLAIHREKRTNEPNSPTTADFLGKLTLGEIDFLLAATKPADPNDGWFFSGMMEEGEEINIGDVLLNVVEAFGFEEGFDLPDYIGSLVVTGTGATYNTASKNFTFTLTCQFELGDTMTTLTFFISMERLPQDEQQAGEAAYQKILAATILIGEREFEIHFITEPDQQTFLATFRQNNGEEVSILEMLASIAGESKEEMLENGLPDLTLSLNSALFAFNKSQSEEGSTSKYIFGVNISAGLVFDSLPLIGSLPDGMAIGLDSLQFFQITGEWEESQIQTINQGVNIPSFQLPEPEGTNGQLARGFQMSANMLLGKEKQVLTSPMGGSSPAQSNTQAPPPDQSKPKSTSDDVKWFDINKQLGTLDVARIGLAYQEGLLWMFLDSELKLGPLTFILDGLSIGTPITSFDPQLQLTGFGLEYKSGPTEIGGYFSKVPDSEEYAGIAVLKTSTFNLSAIGAYQTVDGEPSFYIYAFLDYPLGGPAFFFITGLAAGFGYNRTIKEPTIKEVEDFPFVRLAIGTLTPANFSEILAQPSFIPVQMGSLFLAFGLKFTSFKLIDSFLLLLVRIEEPFRIDLLGISQIIVPTPVPGKQITPVAKVALAVKGTFIPEKGFLGIEGILTSDSFVISPDAKLTGGFAFFSWFSGQYEGDFVLSLGGYHPDFRVPSHYPSVPRLGLNWEVSSKLTVKGDMYFALVPSAVMAGGSLEATYKDGKFKAWFTAGADFLISWKPYFYDIKIYVRIGASYTFKLFGTHTISVEVGADLHIWGPEFSGTAKVDVEVTTITIKFGAGAEPYKPPISWSEFRPSFLPEKEVCSVQVQSGLVRSVEISNNGETVEYWVINPKEFVLATNSVIPITKGRKGEEDDPNTSAAFGIAPMAVKNTSIESIHQILITRKDNNDEIEPVNTEFSINPIIKPVPAALWGQNFNAGLNGERMLEGMLTGYEVRPSENPLPGETTEILQKELQFDTELAGDGNGAFTWNVPVTFSPGAGEVDLNGTETNRSTILTELGLAEDSFNLTEEDISELLASPVSGTIS